MNTELNQNQPKTQVKGIIFLLITAIVWGTSFVSQSVGSEVVRPFTFMGIRTLLGSFVLMPVIFVRDKIQEKSHLLQHRTCFLFRFPLFFSRKNFRLLHGFVFCLDL